MQAMTLESDTEIFRSLIEKATRPVYPAYEANSTERQDYNGITNLFSIIVVLREEAHQWPGTSKRDLGSESRAKRLLERSHGYYFHIQIALHQST